MRDAAFESVHATRGRAPEDSPGTPANAAARALAWLHNSRWPIRVITGLILFVTVLALPYASMARSAPRWWSEVSLVSEAARGPAGAEAAQRLENAITTELHRGRRGGESWEFTLHESQANAWIAHRLPRWLAHRDPAVVKELPEVRVRFEPGRVLLGAQQGDRVVGCALQVGLDDRGALRAKMRDARVGRAPLPGSLARSVARDAMPQRLREDPDAVRILEAVLTGTPTEERVTLRLEDGRRVRIVGVRVESGTLTIGCVTER